MYTTGMWVVLVVSVEVYQRFYCCYLVILCVRLAWTGYIAYAISWTHSSWFFYSW